MPKTVQIETFYWKGQARYKCPLHWESGAKCEYDSHDLAELRAHMSCGHTRTAGLKVESQPKSESVDFSTHDSAFESARFKEEI